MGTDFRHLRQGSRVCYTMKMRDSGPIESLTLFENKDLCVTQLVTQETFLKHSFIQLLNSYTLRRARALLSGLLPAFSKSGVRVLVMNKTDFTF